METINKLQIIFISSFLCFSSCKNANHIEQYNVNLDSLKTLPDNFYAYRRGAVFIEDLKLENYRIWFNRDNNGNIKSIGKIENFKNTSANLTATILDYEIDTSEKKVIAQKFIDLSRKYKFGHIKIDKENIISFSYKDGLAEQYVKTMNDSLKQIYQKKKGFILLDNNWFENIER